ncbi:MAG: prolyl oligopeptidase family serine peptidase [Thermoanaerobaculia bacterium]
MSVSTRRPTVPLALAVLVGCLAPLACGRAPEHSADGLPDPRQVPEYTIEQFLDTTSYGGASFSPDGGRVLVHSDASGIFNLYALPVDGGPAEPLTASTTDNIFSVGYFPEDGRILYRSDHGGNELFHLWVREEDGSVRDLTPGEELRAEFYGWADDDSSFYIGTNERDPKVMDVYEVSPTDYSRELLFENDEAYSFGDVSPDGTLLALSKNVGNADNDVYVHDFATGETRLLTDVEGDVNYYPVEFTPDGGDLLMLTDEGSEFLYLVSADLENGTRRSCSSRVGTFPSPASRRAGATSWSASTPTRAPGSRSSTRWPAPRSASPRSRTPRSARSASRATRAAWPSTPPAAHGRGDLFVQALPEGEPRQLTRSLSAEIDPADLVEAEVVRFESFDGVEIPGILYRPHAASEEAPVPALVWVHGGPGGQSTVGYSALLQYLVNHGYAVYAINNRGSSGYGKTFNHMDDRAHGEGDLDDCVASKEMLAGTGVVDPDRIGILGGSYGGYMVLAALTTRPEEFAVGVDLFGISNWYRTVQNIPPWWEAFRAYLTEEMGDFEDEEYFRSISPLFHAQSIVKPLMVLRGERPAGAAGQVRRDRRGRRANGCPSSTSCSTTRATASPRRRTGSRATARSAVPRPLPGAGRCQRGQ